MNDVGITFDGRHVLQLIVSIWTGREHIIFGTDECLRIDGIFQNHILCSPLGNVGTIHIHIGQCLAGLHLEMFQEILIRFYAIQNKLILWIKCACALSYMFRCDIQRVQWRVEIQIVHVDLRQTTSVSIDRCFHSQCVNNAENSNWSFVVYRQSANSPSNSNHFAISHALPFDIGAFGRLRITELNVVLVLIQYDLGQHLCH